MKGEANTAIFPTVILRRDLVVGYGGMLTRNLAGDELFAGNPAKSLIRSSDA